MKSKIKVMGIEAIVKEEFQNENAVEDADKIAENSIESIGKDAANRAPVLTGLLRRTMTESIQRVDEPIGIWAIIDTTGYSIYQEYNNSRRSAFALNSALAEEPKFVQAMTDRFAKGKGK